MNRASLGALASVAAFLAASPSLLAQTVRADSSRSSLDLAVGLTFSGPADVNLRPLCDELSLPCNTPRTFPDFGAVLQVTAHATTYIAIVAEASVYANMWDTVGVGTAAKRDNNTLGLLVGPRVMTGLLHLTSKDKLGYRAFAQVLGGAESSTVVPTRFALQPGAGIDFELSQPGMWARAAGDYRFTRGGPRNLSSGRLMIALVVAR